MVVYTKAWESYHYCKYCPILSVFVDFSDHSSKKNSAVYNFKVRVAVFIFSVVQYLLKLF